MAAPKTPQTRTCLTLHPQHFLSSSRLNLFHLRSRSSALASFLPCLDKLCSSDRFQLSVSHHPVTSGQ